MKSSHYSHHDERCPTIMSRDFWSSDLSISCRPPSATSRPSLDRHRSTRGPRPYVDHTESHVLYTTQNVSLSRHQHHHDAPGMACMHRGTSLQQHLQRPSRLLLQGTPLGFVVDLDPPLESIKGEGKELSRGRDKRLQDQHLEQFLIFSFSETWGQLSL
jgi:hypothetical protein